MSSQETTDVGADASLAQAKKSAPYFKKLLTSMSTGPMGMTGHAGHDTSSVRTAEHNGHHIVVQTTYKITIDGKPFNARLGVTNGGTVHYHGMPNAGFASAIDLVKSIIDNFPDEFEKGSGGGMEHGKMHMPMRRKTKAAPKKAKAPSARRRR